MCTHQVYAFAVYVTLSVCVCVQRAWIGVLAKQPNRLLLQ